VPLSLFSDRNYSLMNWISGVMSFGMLGLFLPLTIYFQSVLGVTALRAGLTLAPMSLVSMVVAPNAGRLVDRIGGKYILMVGLTLFAAGMGLIILVASPDSTWFTFLLPRRGRWTGDGLHLRARHDGCDAEHPPAPGRRGVGDLQHDSPAGRRDRPLDRGGRASEPAQHGVERRGGQPVGRAGRRSCRPPRSRSIVDSFSNSGQGGLEVGRGQTGAASANFQLPANLPASVAHQVQQQVATYFHDVFVNAYLVGMRPTLLISVAVVLLGAISCLGIQRRKAAAAAAAQELERSRAAAG